MVTDKGRRNGGIDQEERWRRVGTNVIKTRERKQETRKGKPPPPIHYIPAASDAKQTYQPSPLKLVNLAVPILTHHRSVNGEFDDIGQLTRSARTCSTLSTVSSQIYTRSQNHCNRKET